MRHLKTGRKLSRNTKHRRATLRNLARNLARRRHPVSYLSDSALEWLESVCRRIEARPGQAWADRLDALVECLAALAERDRSFISLHYFKGRSYQEISARLQTSVENVRKRLYRVRRRLADCVLRRLEVSDV